MENSNENLNDAFKSADLGDKMWMFFKKYSRAIVSAVAIIGLIFGLTFVIMVGRSICKKSMKSAYLEAIQPEEKENFARKYISKPLGGAIFLELGDEAYGKKEYRRAADCYHHAHVSLGDNILGWRAAIGEGVALAKLGLPLEGEEVFTRIAEKKSHPPSIRGQGMYLLANSLYERRELAKAKGILNQLINGNFSERWKVAAKALLQTMAIEQ
jgi:tetratricopeptide (TPR) repeat protein